VLIILDSGPLGLLSNPSGLGPAHEAQEWARRRLQAGDHLIVPEIADYEVRRELLRARKEFGLARLDQLCDGLEYLPLSTSAMRTAATLWAKARNDGLPTAHDAALDGDVILAAQSRGLQATQGDETVLVATTNAKHLERYVDAREWTAI